MDIKVDGLTYEIVEEALEKCRKGRLYILDQIIKPVMPSRARAVQVCAQDVQHDDPR